LKIKNFLVANATNPKYKNKNHFFIIIDYLKTNKGVFKKTTKNFFKYEKVPRVRKIYKIINRCYRTAAINRKLGLPFRETLLYAKNLEEKHNRELQTFK
jgi:hypothetical protein